jgi:hypothetical protein
MRERESQVERDVADDIETDEFDVSESGFDVSDSGFDTSDSADAGFETGEAGREEESPGWLRSRLGTVATTRSLLVAFVLTVAGMVGFGAIPFLGLVGELLGIAAGGFLYGVGSGYRRYVEMAVAGAVAGGGTALLGNLVIALVASGGTLVAAGVAGGALAGVVGHYFGRDLRDGLTRDLNAEE